MKKLALVIAMLMICGTAWAMSRKPANEGTTVNVYTNTISQKQQAYWDCLDANFKKASKLDESGKVIAGSTDYALQTELNKACVLPV